LRILYALNLHKPNKQAIFNFKVRNPVMFYVINAYMWYEAIKLCSHT